MKFPKLFSPIKISKLELPNRIVYSPCGTSTTVNDGCVSDRMVDLYAEYARGGAALICVEDVFVHPLGKRQPHDPNFYDDSFMPGMRRIAEAIKSGGAKAALHLSHGGGFCGRVQNGKIVTYGGEIPVAPSPIAYPSDGGTVVPRQLTVDEIVELEDRFADAAWRAKEICFDGVCLH